MATDVSRNDPCPCGSGKKYKVCCIGQRIATPSAKLLPWLAVALALVAGGVVGYFHGAKAGVSVGGAALVFLGILAVLRDPPASSGGGGGGANIDFGR